MNKPDLPTKSTKNNALCTKTKTETWNECPIRFVRHEGEWWAVAPDVAKALDYNHTPHMLRILDDADKGVHLVDTNKGARETTIITEIGIYEAVFNSRKPEAKEFKRWIFAVIKELRQSIGLEGFEVFRMLDKEHQKEAMDNLCKGLRKPVRVDFIKANTIANKAVSNVNGYTKMIKKEDMEPEMLVQRQPILEDTVDLMKVNESLNLGLSVSQTIYGKYH